MLNATKPVVVKFSATFCNTAKDELNPIFGRVALELGATYAFVEVNINRVENTRIDFKIKAFPTIIFIKNGKEATPTTRIIGTTDEETLRATIKQVFENS
jgi:thioredoxin-like negative regulator of GroEL